jgi:hypothetical protein
MKYLLVLIIIGLCIYILGQFHQHDMNYVPSLDNVYDLGEPKKRWDNIYGHVISTSDGKQKRDIRPIGFGLDFLNQMKPVSFRWKDQEMVDNRGRPFIRKYVRAHLGYVAQDIAELLEREKIPTNEFAAFVDNPNGMGLRLDELLPIHTKAIQELSAKVDEIKRWIATNS